MTYCVGMLLNDGLVFLSDSRTNAGVDQINTFRKLTVFDKAGDRVLVLMTSGNLAITQSLVSMLQEAIAATDGRPSLMNVPNLFEAARHIGELLRDVHRRDAEALQAFTGNRLLAGSRPLASVYSGHQFGARRAQSTRHAVGHKTRVLHHGLHLGQGGGRHLFRVVQRPRHRHGGHTGKARNIVDGEGLRHARAGGVSRRWGGQCYQYQSV